MPSTLDRLDSNILQAFRDRWAGVVKATLTADDISVDAITGDYVRASGSFLADGFDLGDEVTASGASEAANNGVAIVEYVDDLRLSVSRPWPGAAALVDEAAGASITLRVGVPAFVKWDGWTKSPASGRPWIREHIDLVDVHPVDLGGRAARVRGVGVYWLTVFYPTNRGTAGAAALRGKIMALIYPAAQLTANGQLVRVLQLKPKGSVEETEWTGLAIAFEFWADTFNPS